jgi:hypothetical protein
MAAADHDRTTDRFRVGKFARAEPVQLARRAGAIRSIA